MSIANIGLGYLSFFSTLALVAVFVVLHIVSRNVGQLDRYLARVGWLPACIVSALIGFAATLLWPLSEAPFIYFQF